MPTVALEVPVVPHCCDSAIPTAPTQNRRVHGILSPRSAVFQVLCRAGLFSKGRAELHRAAPDNNFMCVTPKARATKPKLDEGTYIQINTYLTLKASAP